MRLKQGLYCSRCNRYELVHLMYCPICLDNFQSQDIFLDVRDNMIVGTVDRTTGITVIQNLSEINQQLTWELHRMGGRGSIEIPVKILSAMWGFNQREMVLETVFARYIRWY